MKAPIPPHLTIILEATSDAEEQYALLMSFHRSGSLNELKEKAHELRMKLKRFEL